MRGSALTCHGEVYMVQHSPGMVVCVGQGTSTCHGEVCVGQGTLTCHGEVCVGQGTLTCHGEACVGQEHLPVMVKCAWFSTHLS